VRRDLSGEFKKTASSQKTQVPDSSSSSMSSGLENFSKNGASSGSSATTEGNFLAVARPLSQELLKKNFEASLAQAQKNRGTESTESTE